MNFGNFSWFLLKRRDFESGIASEALEPRKKRDFLGGFKGDSPIGIRTSDRGTLVMESLVGNFVDEDDRSLGDGKPLMAVKSKSKSKSKSNERCNKGGSLPLSSSLPVPALVLVR